MNLLQRGGAPVYEACSPPAKLVTGDAAKRAQADFAPALEYALSGQGSGKTVLQVADDY